MNFIDTHSHLFLEEFNEDLDAVIARAGQVGVSKVFMPNIDVSTIRPLMDTVAKYPNFCYPMMGLHPTSVKEDYRQELDIIWRELENATHFVAVGEVGLDFYWDISYKREQIDAFNQQIQWALKLGLPLVVHSRNAHKELCLLLESYKGTPLSGIFHSFGGSLDEAKELLTFENFFLGINGVLTFKKSTLREVLKEIPLERVVLETDSPYLTPVPNRGKRNESSYLFYTLKALADVYEISVERAADITTRNAQKVFKIIE